MEKDFFERWYERKHANDSVPQSNADTVSEEQAKMFREIIKEAVKSAIDEESVDASTAGMQVEIEGTN